MAARQTTPRSLTSIAGAFLLAVGFLILFSNLDAAAARIAYATGNTGGHVLETLPGLVLALVHGLQSYVFDHAGFLSGVLQFLVSFWPLILIILGVVLLRVALRGRFAPYKDGAGFSAMGDR